MSGLADSENGNGDSLSRWEKLGDEPHASTRVFEVRRKKFRHPRTGAADDFFSLRCVDWVNVIALTSADELVMVRQFRFGIEDFSLEIPGGMIDPGEDPVAAGCRELLEETGYGGGAARLMGSVHANPAVFENLCHLVLVDGVSPRGAQSWDEHEDIEVCLVPVERVLQMARDGSIRHPHVLNALFFFEPEWRRRRAGV